MAGIKWTLFWYISKPDYNRLRNPLQSGEHQSKAIHIHPFALSAVGGVDSGRIHAAVSKDGGESAQIVMRLVIRPRKQMAQIVGKDFFRRDRGGFPDFLNHPPDVASVQSLARSGDENPPGDNRPVR